LYQGYTIYAPNYPGSAGFGMKYAEAPTDDALRDLSNWATWIRENAPGPVCYLAVSSGNIVMERLLQSNSSSVTGAAAIFAISSGPGYQPPVPTLFALGENDPIVPFGARRAELEALRRRIERVRIVAYPNEGHWLRGRDHLRDLLENIDAICPS